MRCCELSLLLLHTSHAKNFNNFIVIKRAKIQKDMHFKWPYKTARQYTLYLDSTPVLLIYIKKIKRRVRRHFLLCYGTNSIYHVRPARSLTLSCVAAVSVNRGGVDLSLQWLYISRPYRLKCADCLGV